MITQCSRCLSALLLLVFIGTCNSTCRLQAAEASRPNILFMFTDDQPQICLGCMGNQHIQTPHLDRLAREGVLFNNAFVTTAICCSNRACILTGQYMRRHGIEDFRTPLSAAAFSHSYPVLLRQAGYRTGYLGKFAIGSPGKEIRHLALPEDQFDYWYGFPQAINFLQKVDGQDRYLTGLMTDKAIEFLRSNPQDQPFCLTVAFKEPHGPWNFYDPDVPNIYERATLPAAQTFSATAYAAQPDFIRSSLNGGTGQKWLESHEAYQEHLRTFYRLITRVDLAVGEILAELQRLGLDNNTLVIYSSDHGSMLGAHGLVGKWLMYEESVRVPFIVRDPRLPAPRRGQRSDEMVLSIDLAPTMLAAAGVAIPKRMQGRNILPLVAGEQVEWRDDWYYEHVYNTNPPRRPIVKCEGVRTRDWKYVRYIDFDPPVEQLFDLGQDPLEEHNLANDDAYVAGLTELRKCCDNYRRTLR